MEVEVEVGAKEEEEAVAIMQETEVKEKMAEVKEATMLLRGSKRTSPPPKK